jgi:hypothetical protein
MVVDLHRSHEDIDRLRKHGSVSVVVLVNDDSGAVRAIPSNPDRLAGRT